MLYFSIPISPFGPFADCCYQLVEDDPRNGARKTLRVNFDEKQVVVFKEVRMLYYITESCFYGS